jgi:integrase
LIAKNPCTVRGAAVERSPERPVVTVVQVGLLAAKIESRYRVMVLLAAWCGLRLGEVLALTVADVDTGAGVVRVDKQMLELKSGERTIGAPKTDAGRRAVTMPPHITPELVSHIDGFTNGQPDALLVTGEKGGPVRRHVFHKLWRETAAAAGAPNVHFHDLRHTGATLAAATGASTKELMYRLGHASPAAALRYQHATVDRDRAIAEALSELVRS